MSKDCSVFQDQLTKSDYDALMALMGENVSDDQRIAILESYVSSLVSEATELQTLLGIFNAKADTDSQAWAESETVSNDQSESIVEDTQISSSEETGLVNGASESSSGVINQQGSKAPAKANVKLDVLGFVSENKTALGDHLVQRDSGLLTTVENALSTVLTKADSFASFVKEKTAKDIFTEAKTFSAFANLVNQQLTKSSKAGLPLLSPEYFVNKNTLGDGTKTEASWLRDFIVSPENGVYEMDDNLKAAVVYAAFKYLGELAQKPKPKYKEVAEFLGIEEADVTGEIYKRYSNSLLHPSTMYNQAGAYVMSAMGISLKKDGSPNVYANIQTTFGGLVYQVLRANNFINTVSVDIRQYELDTGKKSEDPGTKLKFFYQLNKDEKVKPLYEKYTTAYKTSKYVLDTLFAAENDTVYPSSEPIKETANTTKAGTKVPKMLKKVLEQFQATPFVFKQNKVEFLRALQKEHGREFIDTLFGAKSNTEIQQLQLMERDSAEAASQAIRKEIDSLFDVVDNMESVAYSSGMYLKTAVWPSLRVGITSVINPTGSKVHRYLLKGKDWNNTINFNDVVMVQNFLLRISEGLGVATDKQSNAKSLAANITNDATISAGIKAAQAAIKGESYNAQALLLAVDAGGLSGAERIKTYDAIYSYAEYLNAKEAGKTSFTTDIMGEVDGVSNGPIMTLLTYGVLAGGLGFNDLFAKGGFYADDTYKDFNVFRGDNNKDFYEDAGIAIANEVKGYRTHVTGKEKAFVDAIAYFAGSDDIVTRKWSKGAINPLSFGSGLSKAVEGIFTSIIGQIPSAIRKADSEEKHVELVMHLQALGLDVGNPSHEKLFNQFELTKDEIASILGKFQSSIGIPIGVALKDYFDAFITTRDQITAASNVSFNIYNEVRNQLEKEAIANLTEVNGVKPIGLSKQAIAEIDKQLLDLGVTPMMGNLYSQQSNDASENLVLLKTNIGPTTDPTYSAQMTGPFPFKTGYASHAIGYSNKREYVAPGVLGTSVGTHSADSYASFKRMEMLFAEGISSFNMHDSGGTGLAGMQKMAKAFNQATWTWATEYNPTVAIAEMAASNLEAYLDLALKEPTKYPAISSEAVLDILASASQGRIAQLEGLRNIKYVSQYALEGGSYEVTQADIAKVDTLLANAKEAAIANKSTSDRLNKKLENLKVLQNPENLTTYEALIEKAKNGVSLDSLLDVMAESAVAPDYYKSLAKMLKGSSVTVFNTTVENIKNTSHKEAITAKFKNTAFPDAVYTDNTIYLFSTKSNLLLHEAVHSAITQHIKNIESGTITDPAAVTNYNNLKETYATVKAHYEESLKQGAKVSSIIGFALENVDEFVAYGLTSKEFQTYLASVPVYKKNINNAFKSFVESISKVIKSVFDLPLAQFDNTALASVLSLGAEIVGISRKASSTEIRAARGSNGLYTHSTIEIFNALADPANPLRKDTSDHLKSLLSGITEKPYGAFGTYPSSIMENVATDEEATFIDAVTNGYAPIATSIRNENLKLNAQESFAIDQIAVTLETALAQPDMFKFSRTLEKLYVQAQKEITPSNFLTNPTTASAAEKKAAVDLHKFIFDSASTNGQALIRFAAFGLASEQVIVALNGVTTQLPKVELKHTLFSKLQNLFTTVVNFFVKQSTGVTSNQQMKQSLDTLVRRLVLAEAKRQKEVNTVSNINAINKALTSAGNKAANAISKAASSNFVRQGKLKAMPVVGSTLASGLAIAGVVTNMSVNQRLTMFAESGMKLRNRLFSGPLGVTAGIVNEVMGENDIKNKFHRMLQLVKGVESEREKHIENVSKNTLEAFHNGGQDLTKEQLASLSVLLRTGVSGTSYTPSQIDSFLSNTKVLDKEISTIKTKLKTEAGKYSDLLNYKAEALGYKLMVGEEADVLGGASNALNIVRLSGLPMQGRLNAKEATLQPIVYDLITLYAFKHMDSVSKQNASNVTNTEIARGVDNGIQFITALHKHLTKEAKSSLFNNKDGLMQHGYLPEVVNPRVNVISVTGTTTRKLDAQVEIYKKAGYRVYGTGRKDANDANNQSVLMVHDNLPETRRLTGLLSVIDNGSKGTDYVTDINDPIFGAINRAKVQKAVSAKQQELSALRTNNFTFTPPSTKLMTALTDEDGNVVNFRYLANTKFRDNVLQRNNNVGYLLGKLHGTTYEKVNSKEHNKNTVKALHDLYSTNYKGNERDYLFVGAKASSKEYKEAYYLLPADTRKEVESVWGTEGMFIRKDMLDLIVGYRKLTLGDALLKSKTEQVAVVKGVSKLAEFIYARNGSADAKYAARLKASVLAKQYQRGWEEIVSEGKDIIVLRTGMVLMGNLMSNVSMLKLSGMGLLEALQQQGKGLEALNVYRAQAEELDKLETYIATGTRTNEHLEFIKRIGLLKEAMNKNPVKELIDDGFMPSIVEDVETASDDYSYKEQFLTYLGKKADKSKLVSKVVKPITKQFYISEDTSMHKFMRYSTQVSDFTARYALNEHLKKDKTLSKEARYQNVSEAFVFYDVPSHRLLEAGNALGLVMFTKFVLRIQKPLFEAIRKNPTNALLLWLVDHYFSAIEVVTESSFTERFYNPLKYGAFEYPFIVDDLATFKAATSVASSLVPGD